mgnify:CR=1 FL=1
MLNRKNWQLMVISMSQEKNTLKQAAGDAYSIRRFITDLSLIAMGIPVAAGGLRGLYTLSKFPVTNNDREREALYDIEYKLLKYNPDLFTKTQIERIGKQKRKEILEQIKKIKEEQEAASREQNDESENTEEKPKDDAETISNFITKGSSYIKFAEGAEEYGKTFTLLNTFMELLFQSPIYPFALVTAPAASYILGQKLVSRINKDTTNKHTRKYMEAAKSRFYNDLLDLQLFDKKRREQAFSYENLVQLPLKSRKKLRDILLEHSGRDYGPYLGLGVKYPELLPGIKGVQEDEKGAGVKKQASGSSAISTFLGYAFLIALAYPTAAFTLAAVNSYMKADPKDPLDKLKSYLEQKREGDVIPLPEQGIPGSLSRLSQSISGIVRPREVLVGIMDEKSTGLPPTKNKPQPTRKEKDKDEDKEFGKTVPGTGSAVSSVPVDAVVAEKVENMEPVESKVE